MPTIPCTNVIDCPDTLLLGYDSEAVDNQVFSAIGYQQVPMPLGATWSEFGGVAVATSSVSQADAQASADAAALAIATGPPIFIPPVQPTVEPAIIKDVDKVCYSEDAIPLSDALESRVLPWLQKLSEFISLWHETMMAGFRLGISDTVS